MAQVRQIGVTLVRELDHVCNMKILSKAQDPLAGAAAAGQRSARWMSWNLASALVGECSFRFTKDTRRWRELMAAGKKGLEELAEKLAEKGTDINTKDS
jgi:hypothetical protein